MFIYAPRISTSFFLIGITSTAAKIGNYNTVGDVHDTIVDVCAEANLPRYSKVDKLCTELGPDGLDIGLDETITLYDGAPDGAGPTFNMREILAAKDAEAAFDEIQARNQKQTERKLAIDYGWCSSSIGMIFRDGSNYCDMDQTCDSFLGCDTDLSRCCIVHDKCLSSPASYATAKCPAVNCKGATCDANLSACASNVSCCSWLGGFVPFCDGACMSASTAVSGLFGLGDMSPKAGHNTDGADSDTVCLA